MRRYLRIKRNGLHFAGIHLWELDQDIISKINSVNTYVGGIGPVMRIDNFNASHLRTLVESGQPGNSGSYLDTGDGSTWSVEVETSHW